MLNRRTNRMKIAAAKRLRGCTWVVTRGSYNPGGVGASAGTHDGGGRDRGPQVPKRTWERYKRAS